MELTDSEKEDLRIILEHIFGSEVTSWEMNEEVLRETAGMLEETRTCSEAFDYVPRPTYCADLSYFKRQLRDMARRAQNHDRIYQTCRSVRAWQWKTRIAAASQGL